MCTKTMVFGASVSPWERH